MASKRNHEKSAPLIKNKTLKTIFQLFSSIPKVPFPLLPIRPLLHFKMQTASVVCLKDRGCFPIKPTKINKMKTTKGQLRSGFTLVELLVVISIIVVLAGLAVPTAMKALGKAEQVTGINNVKGIKSGLDLFAQDFDGEYPSDDTAEELGEISDDNVSSSSGRGTGSKSRLDRRNLDGGKKLGERRSSRRATASNSGGSTSNDYFNQLIAARALDNEDLFYLKSFKKAFLLKKPNNDKKIDQGENVWGYTKNLQQTSSSHLPVVFDSPISGGDSPKFSGKVWDGKVIMARLDSSTRTELIGGSDKKSGPVRGKIDGERLNLFSPEALEEGIMVPADLKRIGSGN